MLDVYKKNCKIKLQTKGGVRTQKGEELVYSTNQTMGHNKSPAISSLVAWNKEIEMVKKESQLTVRWLACFHLADQTDHGMSWGAAWGGICHLHGAAPTGSQPSRGSSICSGAIEAFFFFLRKNMQ